MSNNKCKTLKDLRNLVEELDKYNFPDNMPVVIARDGEGNEFRGIWTWEISTNMEDQNNGYEYEPVYGNDSGVEKLRLPSVILMWPA